MPDDAAAREVLLARPTAEQEVARLAELQSAIQQALTAELGVDQWSELEGGQAGCGGDFSGLGGQTGSPPGLLLTGGITDEQWPAAVRVVADVAAESGFGAPFTVVDNPGEHQIVLQGEREANLNFGTLQNATLQISAGCHLPAAERDAPAPPG